MEISGTDLELCIDECRNCALVCTETIYDCLSLGEEFTGSELIGLLGNCASLCDTAAHFMMSGSELHRLVCGTCAEVCERCAEICATVGEELESCVVACRNCADSCREMATLHSRASAGISATSPNDPYSFA